VSDEPNIVLFVGSVKPASHTASLVEYAASQLRERGASTTIWYPLERPLAIADPAFHLDATHNPDENTRWLNEKVEQSSAVVWSSPVYHNSYSGVLKNALDAIPVASFAGKPIGLLGQGGNRTTQAVDHLRIVARGVNAVATTAQVCTFRDDYEEVDGKLVLTDLDMHARVSRFANELMAFIPAMDKLRES
jgi:NAD(P)H-dependent FMN reductase